MDRGDILTVILTSIRTVVKLYMCRMNYLRVRPVN